MSGINLSFVKPLMPKFNDFLENEHAQEWTEERNIEDIFLKKTSVKRRLKT